jgi:hypothetical protein
MCCAGSAARADCMRPDVWCRRLASDARPRQVGQQFVRLIPEG